MIDGNSGFAIEREIHVKKIKRLLDNWRELTLFFNSVLLWRKSFYPWVIGGLTTYIFFEFAIYDPSFLTSVGLICLIATLVDYGGPSISSMIWRHEDWSTAKEREFEDVCRALASAVVYVKQSWSFMMDLKETKPTVYFLVTISCSLFLAIIGNSVNNVAILYVICLYILMLPGLLHYGILQKYYKTGLSYIVSGLRSFNSSVCKPKAQ